MLLVHHKFMYTQLDPRCSTNYIYLQLAELIVENGPEYLGIHIENKKEILMGLHDASTMEPQEDWEGATAEQLLIQLASSWEINIQ